jgi:hypothetical protein
MPGSENEISWHSGKINNSRVHTFTNAQLSAVRLRSNGLHFQTGR